jgi:hypothetical protein
MPHIIWVKGGNGEIVKDVPGLRQVRTEGGGAPNKEDKFGGDDLLFIERIRAI